ncbi:cytochrome P450 [Frankia sp. CNm7]|uniref:Cytochrome P450 n=1 Tax=Frankia nepalensis TaxID=1836974 RepID=A0A937UW18_9ACTN|nr:cytochrome P450 [Frankia nepalensis]MBL7514438.1 cytochrome P450 [Frankia nepalensis]MBL7524835.1 cytochrome P450 [Frankia nepalensis]MBL7632911.1 cytochrome P450 [Frankia nepalensis]
MALRYPAHADAVRLYGDGFHRDPRTTYQRLRERYGAVAPVLLDDDVPAWLVLGYRELHFVAGEPNLFSKDSRLWNAWNLVPADWPLRPLVTWRDTLLSADGAEHDRHSAAVDATVSSIDLLELAARCERIADDLIDAFASEGSADLIGQYAARLPLLVGTALLALPPAQAADFTDDMAAVLGRVGDVGAAEERLRSAVRRHTAARRANPGSDPLSTLATHPAALTDDEVFDNLFMLFLLGHAKTAAWIGNALRLMLTDPRFAARLAGGRRSVEHVLDDVLWEDPPNSNALGRWATRTVQLGAQHVRPGDLVVLSVAAANADPVVRPDRAAGPGRNQAHLAFGSGPHRCPYPSQDISLVTTRAALSVLLDRLPDITLAAPASELVWQPAVFVRSLTALPVVFTPIPPPGFLPV